MANGASFPQGFTFGVSTSAYQVEGCIENDWSEWERQGRLNQPNVTCGRGATTGTAFLRT
jgi:beta-glucosidase